MFFVDFVNVWALDGGFLFLGMLFFKNKSIHPSSTIPGFSFSIIFIVIDGALFSLTFYLGLSNVPLLSNNELLWLESSLSSMVICTFVICWWSWIILAVTPSATEKCLSDLTENFKAFWNFYNSFELLEKVYYRTDLFGYQVLDKILRIEWSLFPLIKQRAPWELNYRKITPPSRTYFLYILIS